MGWWQLKKIRIFLVLYSSRDIGRSRQVHTYWHQDRPTKPGRKWNSPPLYKRIAFIAFTKHLSSSNLLLANWQWHPFQQKMSFKNLNWYIWFSGSMTGFSCPACGPQLVSALSTTTSSGYGAPSSWRTGSLTTSRHWSLPTTSSRHFSASGFFTKPQSFGWQVPGWVVF